MITLYSGVTLGKRGQAFAHLESDIDEDDIPDRALIVVRGWVQGGALGQPLSVPIFDVWQKRGYRVEYQGLQFSDPETEGATVFYVERLESF